MVAQMQDERQLMQHVMRIRFAKMSKSILCIKRINSLITIKPYTKWT